jgi:hypothetical protein
MEMPRYKKISVRECEEKEYRARQGFFNNLLEEITDEARNLIKVLNRNGDLLISAGNFKSRYNKKNNQAEYEMFRGLCFTPELYLTDYPDKTFSWSSK